MHAIPSFSKVGNLVNKITDKENCVRNIEFLLLLIIPYELIWENDSMFYYFYSTTTN